MWKLNLPPRNGSMKNIDKALTKKNGTKKFPITNAEKETINQLYKAYDTAKGVPSASMKGGTLSAALLDAMKAGYNQIQINGRLEKFRDKLLLQADTCPCCGIGDPDELDHYLPKDDYKPLAIYSRNLIPYCHKCNNKKRSVDGSDPDKRFINAYYDDLPYDQQFLIARVRLRGKGLTIKLEVQQVAGLSTQLVKQMNFQMRRVNLNKRLKKALNTYLGSLADSIQADYESGGEEAVKLNLRRTAKGQGKRIGINHWRSVIPLALANHRAFCNGGFYEPLSLERPPAPVKTVSVK